MGPCRLLVSPGCRASAHEVVHSCITEHAVCKAWLGASVFGRGGFSLGRRISNGRQGWFAHLGSRMVLSPPQDLNLVHTFWLSVTSSGGSAPSSGGRSQTPSLEGKMPALCELPAAQY